MSLTILRVVHGILLFYNAENVLLLITVFFNYNECQEHTLITLVTCVTLNPGLCSWHYEWALHMMKEHFFSLSSSVLTCLHFELLLKGLFYSVLVSREFVLYAESLHIALHICHNSLVSCQGTRKNNHLQTLAATTFLSEGGRYTVEGVKWVAIVLICMKGK